MCDSDNVSEGVKMGKGVWGELDFLFEKWRHHDNLMYSRQATFWIIQGAMFAAVVYGLRDSHWILPDRLAFIGATMGVAAVIGFGLIRLLIMDVGCRNSYNKRICELLKENTSVLAGKSIDETGWAASDPDHPVNQWHTPEVSKKKYWWQIGVTNYNASIVIEAVMMLVMLAETVIGVAVVVWALRLLFGR